VGGEQSEAENRGDEPPSGASEADEDTARFPCRREGVHESEEDDTQIG
jgi:hypothetical protein